ncbi:intradiol ring-cleavage dioxygenase [Microbacterium sp. MM2322]|uniref:intradiol ring-cleavage dioxygenase n=1 Tax=Microbacterium sp. MM2322 TaxID=3157631 RepID=UPI0032D5B048
MNSPRPTDTPDGPAFEGRLLDRPEDDVVDQGAAFDIRTLLTRRSVFGALGIVAGAAVLAACTPRGSTVPATSAAASPSVAPSAPAASADAALPAGEIPEETAGPYPGDGSNGPDALERAGVVRSDLRSDIGGGESVAGVALTFTLRLTDMAQADRPLTGAAVYAWQCDAEGRYSMYTSGVEDRSWLRGVQVTDADGQVTFTSIVPGCYPGRWPHIHFEVYPDEASITDAGTAIATSQLAFPASVADAAYAQDGYGDSARNLSRLSLDSDMVFGDDGGALQLATVTGSAGAGYAASLAVRIDATT